MIQKSYNKIEDNYIYDEEIDSNKVNEYKEKKKKRKIIIFVIIILLAVFLGMLIGHLLFKDHNANNIVHKGDLLGIYTNNNFINYIDNISIYNSYENSNKYIFYVRNDNDFKIAYSLYLEEEKLNNKVFANKKYISYAIIKNNKKIKQGKLSSIKNNLLLETTIDSNEIDSYEIRLWNNKTSNGYYNYKVLIKN